jgi:hypothetical protein
MKNIFINGRPLTTEEADVLWVSSLSFEEAFECLECSEGEFYRLCYLRCKATEYERFA